MEYTDLANKIGVKNIIVSHINSDHYKNVITVMVNDDLILYLVGKTMHFIPLTKNGVGKMLASSSANKILNRIEEELRKESF